MLIHRLAYILLIYLICLLFLFCTVDTGEAKRYRGRSGAKRLFLHGLLALVIVLVLGRYLSLGGPHPPLAVR